MTPSAKPYFNRVFQSFLKIEVESEHNLQYVFLLFKIENIKEEYILESRKTT